MRRIACLVGLALSASMLAASPVDAAGHPTLHLKVPAHAHANKAATVTYSVSGAGSDAVALQRLSGTTWQTVKKLHSTTGTVTLPALQIGVYDLRLAAYTTHGQLVSAVGHKLRVFGKVKFAQLFNLPTHAYSTPAANFHYTFQFYNGRGTYTALVVKNAPCDSVHIQFIPGTDSGTSTVVGVSSGTLYLGRHNRSKLHATVAPQHVGRVGGPLDLNGAWSLLVAQAASGGQLMTWYVNGFADCDAQGITTWATPGSD
ncbi:MAG TPA: hypothetical protein VHW74_18685 [Mycobacteriales bacterium]|jgi:hypothetical protein|nr:hypothetical protein [Mycobacteriales bacterium]